MTDHPVDLDKHRGMAAQKPARARLAPGELENGIVVRSMP